MHNIIRTFRTILSLLVLTLTACGGGGGSDSGSSGGSSSQPQYSISVSPQSVSLSGIAGSGTISQTVTVNFNGDGVVVGSLPGQIVPTWLSVNAPTQSTSPVNVVISAGLGAPNSASTTLRFVTGKADGSNVVSVDVPVTLQLIPGQSVFIKMRGIAAGSSVAATLNNGTPKTLFNDLIDSMGMVAVGSNYSVNIPTQPPGQTCIFPDGTSTLTALATGPRADLLLNCNASVLPLAWMGGTKTSGDAPVYGTRRVATPGNTPGGRLEAAYAADASGNFWVFGGRDGSGAHSDLWRYDVAAGTWTWMSGSTSTETAGVYGTLNQASGSNAPGARTGAVAWFDSNGRFWLFGGSGYGSVVGVASYLNDLWMYDIAGDMWTWVGGSNTVNLGSLGTYNTTPSTTNIPGGRTLAAAVKDANGDIWLLGGYGLGAINSYGFMDDLWKFTPSTRVWTWVAGQDRPGTTDAPGTQGVPAANNHPSGRARAALWSGSGGSIWLFGGMRENPNSPLNDMWRFDIATGMWTWMGGTDPTTNFSPDGRYNAPNTSGNIPAGRASAAFWSDASGNFWIFGGTGPKGVTNDLWKYSPSNNSWSWLNGTYGASATSVYGTQGIASLTSVPAGRAGATGWVGPNGRLWLWSGANDLNFTKNFNDFWQVTPQ